MKGVKQTPKPEVELIFEAYGQDYCTRITGIPRTTLNTWAHRYNWHKPNNNEVKIVMAELIKQKFKIFNNQTPSLL